MADTGNQYVKVIVTAQMIEAGERIARSVPGLVNRDLASIYRAMRALEPITTPQMTDAGATRFTLKEFRVCVRAVFAFAAGYKLGERYKLGELERRRGQSADAEAWELGYQLSSRRYEKAYGANIRKYPYMP